MDLIDVSEVSRLLCLSRRKIWRMRDAGAMPAPVSIGRAVRWRRVDVAAWIAAGCPDVRRTGWKAPHAA